jgi:hypothetical protein
MRTVTPPARVAIYAFEPAGRGDLRRLDAQVRRLADQVVARPGWWTVATYADRGGTELFARPGLARLVCDAAYRSFDVVVVDSPHRLGCDARPRQELVGRLAACGVRLQVIGRSRLGKLVALAADLVLADLIGLLVRLRQLEADPPHPLGRLRRHGKPGSLPRSGSIGLMIPTGLPSGSSTTA